MLHHLRCCTIIVLSVSAAIHGRPSPAVGIQVAAIPDRTPDGSHESDEQKLTFATEVESLVETTASSAPSTTHDRTLLTETPMMDVITLIWYLATFVALISFFLVMACADRNRCRSRKPAQEELTAPPTPAPSYRQFAPPNYDTLVFEKDNDSIFIIPYDARAESEHQQCAVSLAGNLEIVIDRQRSNSLPQSPNAGGIGLPVPTSDTRSEGAGSGAAAGDVPAAPGVTSAVPCVRAT